MPVQVACYADNSTIEAFLHQIPLNILSVPGTRNTRAEIPEDFRRSRLPGVLANTATALQAPCHDWFTRIYFRPYYAQQEQITKSVTRIRAIWMATGVAPVDQVVWEGRSADSNTAEREPYKDIELFANELNIAIENRLKPLAANLSFTPPTKGEFEKTADYDVRVHNAHEAFTAAQDSNAAAVRSSIMQARNQVFNAFLGSPTISESKYDADKEMLTIGITSPKSPFRVTATIAIPPEEARTLYRRWLQLHLTCFCLSHRVRQPFVRSSSGRATRSIRARSVTLPRCRSSSAPMPQRSGPRRSRTGKRFNGGSRHYGSRQRPRGFRRRLAVIRGLRSRFRGPSRAIRGARRSGAMPSQSRGNPEFRIQPLTKSWQSLKRRQIVSDAHR